MTDFALVQVASALARVQTSHSIGRVCGTAGGTVQVSGLGVQARLGDRVAIQGTALGGEVIRLEPDVVHVLTEGPVEGVAIGDALRLLPPPLFAPDATWIGRVIDPDGKPLDGRPLLPGIEPRALWAQPPGGETRRAMGARLETGLAAFNTLLPLVQGQRIGLFAGSGVGKSTLIADLARGISADVVVIALVGERGREVRHFVEDVLGEKGMQRAVIVAATSDRAPQVRRRCAWSAMAVAEYFRDQGLHVMLFVDSVTRFCEAHREVAVASGEAPALRGFPASTASILAALCERAGPGAGDMGDITAAFSVLVAGSDMEEPVADMLRGVLDGHVVLDRTIAERGRFPAVDVLRSVSRSLPAAATRVENTLIGQARQLMGDYDRAELMIQAGLYVAGSDPKTDAAIACQPQFERFMTVKDHRGIDAHFAVLRQAIAAGQPKADTAGTGP